MSISQINEIRSPASFPQVANTATGDFLILLRDQSTQPKLRLISTQGLGLSTGVEKDSVLVSSTNTLNFFGDAVTITDDAINGKAEITVGVPIALEEVDQPVTNRLNFKGTGFTINTDLVNNRTDIEFTGGGGGTGKLDSIIVTGISVNATEDTIHLISGTTLLTLPTAPANGTQVVVADYDQDFANVPITIVAGGGDLIQGLSQITLSNNNATLQLTYHTGKWTIFGTESFYDNSIFDLPNQNVETFSGTTITLDVQSERYQDLDPGGNFARILVLPDPPETGLLFDITHTGTLGTIEIRETAATPTGNLINVGGSQSARYNGVNWIYRSF